MARPRQRYGRAGSWAWLCLVLSICCCWTAVHSYHVPLSHAHNNNKHGNGRSSSIAYTRSRLFSAIPSNTNNEKDNNNNNKQEDSSLQIPRLRLLPPRNICVMIEPTPFTHVSGYANRFKEMLKYLSKAGDDVEILTVDSKTPAAQLPDKAFGFPIKHTLGFTFPLYNQISLTLDLPELKGATILERMQPDLIHVTSPGFMLFPAILYARAFRLPLVMSYHTHLPSYAVNYLNFIPKIESLAWDALRWVHRRADLTLVTSPQMRDELAGQGIPRVAVWRKGIDTDRFHPHFQSDDMRHEMTDGHPDDFVLIYVGRLGAEKRLKDIKPMLERIPQARLVIVGKGPQQQELQEYFKDTKTKFMGQRSGDELSQLFASADVFCMPSDSETLGFVVLESMASGVPVVGAKAGGIPSLIRDGVDGYLVDPGDIDGFVQRLEGLRQNKDNLRTTMGQAARAEAERWGWEGATSVLRNIQYERAVHEASSRGRAKFGQPGSGDLMRLIQWKWIRFWDRIALQWTNVFGKLLRKWRWRRQKHEDHLRQLEILHGKAPAMHGGGSAPPLQEEPSISTSQVSSSNSTRVSS